MPWFVAFADNGHRENPLMSRRLAMPPCVGPILPLGSVLEGGRAEWTLFDIVSMSENGGCGEQGCFGPRIDIV